jgi:hypothetical protein
MANLHSRLTKAFDMNRRRLLALVQHIVHSRLWCFKASTVLDARQAVEILSGHPTRTVSHAKLRGHHQGVGQRSGQLVGLTARAAPVAFSTGD